MIQVLLDTNIILDFCLKRDNFFDCAEEILKGAFEGRIKAYITATTVTDIFYISRKERGKREALAFISSLIDFVDIADVNKAVIINSLNSDFDDFEDAVQDNSAQLNNLDLIITRNHKDFCHAATKITTPADFIKNFL